MHSEKTQSINLQPFHQRPSVWWAAVMLIASLSMQVLPKPHGPSFYGSLYISVAISILAASGFWLGFGRHVMRVPFTIATCAFVTVYLAFIDGGPPPTNAWFFLTFLSLLVVGIVSIPVLVAKYVRRGVLSNSIQAGNGSHEVFQFDIRHLFILTTVVAAMIGVGKLLSRYLVLFEARSEWLMVTKIGVSLGICSLIVVWATLGKDAISRTAYSTCALIGISYFNSMVFDEGDRWTWVWLTVFVWIQVSLLMLALRWEGYRFVVRSGIDEPTSDGRVKPSSEKIDPFA